MSAAFLRWDGGTLFFDLVVSEVQELTSQVTEHPVEKGPNVTDHVRAETDRVRLEILISSKPQIDSNARGAAFVGVDLDTHGVPGEKRALVQQFPDTFDPVADVHQLLRALRDAAQLITVVTSTHDFDDMVIVEVNQKKSADTGGGASFDVLFRQIRRVETKLVKAPTPRQVRDTRTVNKGAQDPEPVKDPEGKKTILAGVLDLVHR